MEKSFKLEHIIIEDAWPLSRAEILLKTLDHGMIAMDIIDGGIR